MNSSFFSKDIMSRKKSIFSNTTKISNTQLYDESTSDDDNEDDDIIFAESKDSNIQYATVKAATVQVLIDRLFVLGILV